ncbi:GPI transamidase component GPI16 precursor [Periconia macrospinosa]|uniref:GPI transamidase component GPI16 n=1 Tax=Periconia macrospinosa TaxID=97972 RepID=A0A2V1DZP0_9PLEO|nr:GPI transamidase component GPI16 precursor [Periconia macrospinosa]
MGLGARTKVLLGVREEVVGALTDKVGAADFGVGDTELRGALVTSGHRRLAHELLCDISDYHERLILRPLPQSTLLASFNFRSNESSIAFEQQNFRYFPRSLGQILQHAHTKELHLRFSVGRWDAESWGQRPWHGAREGGNGVELWAWIEADNDDEAFTRWQTLVNSLSGLFCASLNFIDATRTIRPVMAFEPEGDHRNASNLHLLHGTLPHEVVCTENLTPFLKLLPCKGKAGISSLLDGHKLFDASFQTMAIDVRPVCDEQGQDCLLEMDQSVDMVLDVVRSKRPQDNPIPRPPPIEEIQCDSSKYYNAEDTCYPFNSGAEPSWSLKEIFGRPLKGACPLTEAGEGSETLCINTPPERTIQVETEGQFAESRTSSDTVRCYKLPVGSNFDLVLPEQQMTTGLVLPEPPLSASRSINGHGQERGSAQSVIKNPSSTDAVEFVYLESLPWFMRPYLHTLRAHVDTTTENPVKETFYRPAVDRQRGSHLEIRMVIPPASTLTLTYDFEKAILRYTEYPPDANRGFDAAPAVIRILSPNRSGDRKGIYLRTTPLLLSLPTPDFSMPYNVIILTSTVMALGFGNIFNLLVRRFVGVDEAPQNGGFKGVLQDKIARLTGRFKKS